MFLLKVLWLSASTFVCLCYFYFIWFPGYYQILCNLVIKIFCRAHTSINFSHWIERCSHTSCLLGPSTEGRTFSVSYVFCLEYVVLLRFMIQFSHSISISLTKELIILDMQAFAEWILFTASGISSGIYHACDVGTWCALNFGVLQVTDLNMMDYSKWFH